MSEMPDRTLYQRIVERYLKKRKVAAITKELNVPVSKVRRVLITEGLWSSPTSRKIAVLLSEGLKKEKIAEKLHSSVHAVEFYLPYQLAWGLWLECSKRYDKTDRGLQNEEGKGVIVPGISQR